jgi:hypothetical protein
VHHCRTHTARNPTRRSGVSKFIIPYLYKAQHVSGDTPPIIRSLKLHSQLDTVSVQQPHVQQPYTLLCKTRGCECSFRLLMMGRVSPETCWASYKYGIINFETLICYFSTTHCSLLRLIVRSGLDVPTFATRRLDACHHARAPSGGRWNCEREMSGNLCVFVVICRWIFFLEWEMFSDKSCRENQNTCFVFNNAPPPLENVPLMG